MSKIHRLLEETPESYYWVGFIMADGHITPNNRLQITLALKDSEHLLALAKFLGIESNYHVYKTTCRLSGMDTINLAKFRLKFNILENKTYSPPIEIIEKFSNQLFLAFLIGYTDGDGTIGFQSGRKDYCIRYRVHSSWSTILDLIVSRLNLIYNTSISKSHISKDGYAQLNIANIDLCKELRKIADTLPSLRRKWDKIDFNFIKKKRVKEDVLNFISQNPNMRNTDISNATGVSMAYITKLKKGGRSQ